MKNKKMTYSEQQDKRMEKMGLKEKIAFLSGCMFQIRHEYNGNDEKGGKKIKWNNKE